MKRAIIAMLVLGCANGVATAGGLPAEPNATQWASADADARIRYGVEVAKAMCPDVRVTPGRSITLIRIGIMLPGISPARVRQGVASRCEAARAENKIASNTRRAH